MPASATIGFTATSSPIIELADGTLLLPVYGRDTPSRHAEDKPGLRDRTAVLRSTDGGRTWGDPVMIDEEPDVHLMEPSLLEMDDGHLLCVMRSQATQSFSSDGGRTWSIPTPIGHRADCPYLVQTTGGTILCGIRHQKETSVIVSSDRAATWSEPLRIDTRPGAYPSIVELDDGRMLCLYYGEFEKGKKSVIRQAIFRITQGPGIEFEEQ